MNEEDIQPKKENEIYCPHCAKPIIKDAVECPHCGVQIKELKVSDNIISPVEKTKVKIVKSVCLSLFCLLLAIFLWYRVREFFYWQEGRIVLDLIYLMASLSIFVIFSLVYLILIENRKIVTTANFFMAFSFLVFFLRENGSWQNKIAIISYIVSSFIVFIILNSVNRNLLYERKNSIVFHPGKSVLKAAPTLMIAFAILFSVVFYFNFPLQNKQGDVEIKEEYLEKTTEPLGGLINRYIPVYNLNMSVDQFIVLTSFLGLPFAMGEEELSPLIDSEELPEEIVGYLKDKGIYDLDESNLMQQMGEDEEFRSIFFEEIKELTKEVSPYLMDKYRKNLSENWGIKLDSKDRMGQVFARFINSKINEIPKKIRDLFLIFPAIALFGILQIAFIILGFVYSFFSWVVLIIFYKAKFYHYIKIAVEKEEIEL